MDDTVRFELDQPVEGDPAAAGDAEGQGTQGSGTQGDPAQQANGQSDGPLGAVAAGVAGGAGVAGTDGCWQLPVVDRARVLAPAGMAAALVGGKLVGSNESATNGFVDLAVIDTAPEDGAWLDVALENATAYRYVKYYGPGGSYGAVADLELFAGEQRLEGKGFGSAGSRDEAGTVFANALDGDASTWFEGPLPNDNYVGLDLGDGHELAAPTLTPGAGTITAGASVSIAADAGASIAYTTDGSDPRQNGQPYTTAIVVPDGTLLIKAVATGDCALPSPVAQAVYSTGVASGPVDPGGPRPPPAAVQSSIHIGNSLTDTIVDHLETVASDGGIALDFNRYSIPGAGTWLYDQNPTGGFGVADVQEALRTRSFDHISMQPFPNWPCQAVPSADGDDCDSGYLAQAWADARTQNPNVQLWVYQQWPAPTEINNCITGGVWTRGDWAPPDPAAWEDAVANELTYQELVRGALVQLVPDAPPPYIVPGGLALVALKNAVESGTVPGISDFFGTFFQAGGTDIHLTPAGAYYITLVFYGAMFQQSPEGRVNDSGGELTDQQAGVLQTLAWQTLTSYPLSGVDR